MRPLFVNLVFRINVGELQVFHAEEYLMEILGEFSLSRQITRLYVAACILEILERAER